MIVVNKKNLDTRDIIDKYAFTYPSKPWLERICLPTNETLKILTSFDFFKDLKTGNVTTLVNDIWVCVSAFVFMLIFAFIAGFVFMMLLRIIV